MTLVYNQLYDLVRRERSHQELQELPPTFYADASLLFAELTESVRRDPLSSAGEAARLQLANGKKLLKQLYDYREQKILQLAQNRCRTGSTLVDTSKLLPSERDLFNKTVILLHHARSEHHIVDLPMEHAKDHAHYAPKETAAESEPVVHAPRADVSPEPITVRVLRAVPQFMGKGMETYGPFGENDRIELPGAVAQLLIRKGAAQLDSE